LGSITSWVISAIALGIELVDTGRVGKRRQDMRIAENKPSRLRLRDRTCWISLVCLGSALILAGGAIATDQPKLFVTAALFLIFALAFQYTTDVTFDKTRRVCYIRRLNVWRPRRMRLAFEDIRDVRVEFAPVEDLTSISCRLSLVTTSGIVPLSAAYEPNETRYDAMRDTVLDAIIAAGQRRPASDPVRMLVEEGRITDAVAVLRRREKLNLTTALTRVNALRDELRA
jgi:hypothetical protein